MPDPPLRVLVPVLDEPGHAVQNEDLRGACRHTGCMRGQDAPKAGWASSLPAGPPGKDGLARIAEAGGGGDDAENSCHEEAADPGFVALEEARRRFRGQYIRRLRRLGGSDRRLARAAAE
jgi:hypothetical protein